MAPSHCKYCGTRLLERIIKREKTDNLFRRWDHAIICPHCDRLRAKNG